MVAQAGRNYRVADEEGTKMTEHEAEAAGRALYEALMEEARETLAPFLDAEASE